jgi:hypothetical protein
VHLVVIQRGARSFWAMTQLTPLQRNLLVAFSIIGFPREESLA